MSTLKTGTVQNNTGSGAPVFKNNAGTEIGQLCKAWVNFDGSGTVAIRDSFNVTSITDNSTGNYTANFTNAMVNDDYAAICGYQANSSLAYVVNIVSQATNSVRHQFFNYANGTALDQSIVNIAVFGD